MSDLPERAAAVAPRPDRPEEFLDPDWEHVTIKMSGHPPFSAQVILNGHEYVACQAKRKQIEFSKEGNCFTDTANAAGLARVADTLSH